MKGIAVVKTISEADAICNDFDFGSRDLMNILKEKRVMEFFVIIFFCMHTLKRHVFFVTIKGVTLSTFQLQH